MNNTTNFRFATDDEIAKWDDLILANPDSGNFLQSYEFGQQKRLSGWTPRFIVGERLAILVLERRVAGIFVQWYLPKGPGVTGAEELKTLMPQIRQFAKHQHVTVVTLDPELLATPELEKTMKELGLQARPNIQVNISTKIMDITPSMDELLAGLSQKTRHAINRAKRDGVKVERVEPTEENCQIMYDLMVETSGGRFPVAAYEYYTAYWQGYTKAGKSALFFAYVDGVVVAGAFSYFLGHKGIYKDGASVRARTTYGASHLLQWRMIEWLKAQGVTVYDLCGAPPAEQQDNAEHPLYGVGRFKAGFVHETTQYIGTFDAVIQPILGAFWHKKGEYLTRVFYRRLLHKGYY